MKDLIVLLALALLCYKSLCQQSPLTQPGVPAFTPVSDTNSIDSVNLVNGNVNIRIPMVSYPQTGNRLKMHFYYYYNQPTLTATIVGNPIGQLYNTDNPHYNAQGFWRLAPYEAIGQTNYPSYGFAHDQEISLIQQQISYLCLDQDCGGPGDSTGGTTAADLLTSEDCIAGYNLDGTSTCANTSEGGSMTEEGEQVDPSSPLSTWNISTIWSGATLEVNPISMSASLDMIVEGDGTQHTYAITAQPGAVTALTADGSGYLPVISNCSPSWNFCTPTSFIDKDGITYTFKDMNGNPVVGGGVDLAAGGPYLTDRTDTNGNTIIDSRSGWYDTAGRIIPHESNVTQGDLSLCSSNASQAWQWTAPGLNGGSLIYTECYGQSVTYDNSLNYNYDYTYYWGDTACIANCPPTSEWIEHFAAVGPTTSYPGVILLTDLVLPNKTRYSFTYDSFLAVKSITLPTGGSISYTYTEIVPWDICNPSNPVKHVVSSRTVSDGLGNSAIWGYSWLADACGSNAPDVNVMVTITDPSGNDTVHQHIGNFTAPGETLTSSTYSYSAAATMVPAGESNEITTYYSGTGSTRSAIKTITTTMPNNPSPFYVPTPMGNLGSYVELSPGPPSSVITQWADGRTSAETFTYVQGGTVTVYNFGLINSGNINQLWNTLSPPYTFVCNCVNYNLLASKNEYDYGAVGSGTPGTLLRTTTTKYQYQTVGSGSAYLSKNLYSLPSSVVVQDGSGVKMSEVDYYYDQAPSPSGARGNLTSVSRWLNTNLNSPASSSTVYNSQGMPILLTDENGNQTSVISYQCSGSLPQKESYAYQSPTTASQLTTYGYDCSSGRLVNVTDANGVITQYSYEDALERLTQVAKAYGVSGSENDSAASYPNMIQVDSKQDERTTGDGVIAHSSGYDGFGRVVQETSSSDPSGPVYIKTSYDPFGRVYQEWNATRCNPETSTVCPGETTWGLTTHQYDALGRQIKRTNPDGTTLSWAYSDDTFVDYFDEKMVHWQYTYDELHRLTHVSEMGTASRPLSLDTYYSYDALGNLLKVTQSGNGSSDTPRVRTFTYDSLSRLLCASNPENSTASCPTSATASFPAGVTVYSYDANGNVVSKTDARGITTNYKYDALNRLLSKTYSNDKSCTPYSYYQYDSTSVSNGIGRLGSSWTQAATDGNCKGSSSGYLTKRTILAYDPMGRVLQEQQATVASQASGKTYSPQYQYDLAGNLIYSTDGSTPSPTSPTSFPSCALNAPGWTTLTFASCFDAAGRLQNVASSWVDPAHPQSLFSAVSSSSNVAYAAFGGLLSATYGTGINLTRGYDKRLRITGETDTGISSNPSAPASATVVITGTEQTK